MTCKPAAHGSTISECLPSSSVTVCCWRSLSLQLLYCELVVSVRVAVFLVLFLPFQLKVIDWAVTEHDFWFVNCSSESEQVNSWIHKLCVGFVFMGSKLNWTWDESYALVLSDQISTQQHTVHGRFWAEVLDQVGKNVVHPFYRVPELLLWQHMGGPRPY